MATKKPQADKKTQEHRQNTAKSRDSGGNSSANRLTPKQERFVHEYLIDLNATQAAIRAGYSAKTAYSQGERLLKNVEVKAAVDSARLNTIDRLGITREMVAREYQKLAFSDPRKFFREDGTLKHPTELDDDTAAALASFEVLEEFAGAGPARYQIGDTKKIKWSDKKAALDSLCRMLGYNQDKVTVEGNPDNPITVLMQQIGGTKFKVKGE